MNRFIPKLPDQPCLSVVPVDQSSPNAYLKDFLILLYVKTYIHTYIHTNKDKNIHPLFGKAGW